MCCNSTSSCTCGNQQAFKVAFCRPGAKIARRMHPTDAGMDFYVPTMLTVKDVSLSPVNNCCNLKEDKEEPSKSFLCYNDIETGDDYIEEIYLKPHQSVVIPSGLKCKVPKNHALVFFNKSGIATKKNLDVGACVVDEGYQGEIHIHVTNTSTSTQTIKAGDKIVQGLLVPVSYADIEVVESEDELFQNEVTERNTGGFGSTDLL